MIALEALKPVKGSVRLVLLRVMALGLAGAVTWSAATGPGELSRSPWIVEAPRPLPFERQAVLMQEFEGIGIWLLLGVLVGVVLDLVVTAGAVRWLHGERRGLVGPFVIGQGTRTLWPMLRVAAVSGALGGAGFGAAVAVGSSLSEGFPVEGFVGAAFGLVWAQLVGAWAHQTQVIVARDGRVRTRRAMVMALRVWRRHWLLGPFPYAAVAVTLTMGSGALLLWWRSVDPAGDVWLWAAAWVVLLAVQAMAWHAMLRLHGLLYEAHPDLMETPDAPWGVVGWVRGKLKRG